MEFKHTLDVLYAQADEIKRIVAKLKEADEIRVIELDLLLEKLRNIYDLILDLESSIPAERRKSQAVKTENQPQAKHEAKEIIDEVEEEQQEEVELKNSDSLEEDIQQIKQKKEPPKKVISKPEQEFVSDRFKGSKHTLHEEMAGRAKQEDISSQYKSKPINNILGAIALNERFELINQLFDGDKIHFERTIEVLNKAGSFVQAYNYLQENFKWDMDNEYVQRILELIRRKLIIRRNEQ